MSTAQSSSSGPKPSRQPSRQPSGVPSGGQFAPDSRGRAEVDLDTGPDTGSGTGSDTEHGAQPQTTLVQNMNAQNSAQSTMQTDRPIERLSMTTTNRPISWLVDTARDRDAGLDMDQPYQRGLVWSVQRKQKLIRSMLEGVPIPSLIINDRFGAYSRGHRVRVEDVREFEDREGGKNWAFAVIDGKQRTSAVLGFYNDEYGVPASWFSPERVQATEDTEDGPYVRYSGLTLPGQRFFSNTTIGVAEGKFTTLAEEQEIFDRVNFGGVAQGESDLGTDVGG